MVRYKIMFDRDLCIGVLACAGIAEKFWKYSSDGKVNLHGAKYNKKTKLYELFINESDFDLNKMAADLCPVVAIKIEKVDE